MGGGAGGGGVMLALVLTHADVTSNIALLQCMLVCMHANLCVCVCVCECMLYPFQKVRGKHKLEFDAPYRIRTNPMCSSSDPLVVGHMNACKSVYDSKIIDYYKCRPTFGQDVCEAHCHLSNVNAVIRTYPMY